MRKRDRLLPKIFRSRPPSVYPGALNPSSKPARLPDSYRYRPLESKSHIRLLSFMHPVRKGNTEEWGADAVDHNLKYSLTLADIDFEISHVDLRQKPLYQALSYVWGDPSDSTILKLRDGGALKITKTLQRALEKVVVCGKVIPIWIDQVCINQADLAERGHQVSIMGDIYLGADTTMAWLGDELEDHTKYLAYIIYSIRKMSRELPEGQSVRTHRENWLRSNVALNYDANEPTIEGKCFRAIHEILQRPWFKRAWIVQESVLSSNVVFLVGIFVFRFWEFVNVVETIIGFQCKIGGYRGSLYKTTKGGEPLTDVADLLRDESQNSSFIRFLWSVGGRWEATEKRDMIFAFLGLLRKPNLFSHVEFNIRPDYTLPLGELYTSVARTVIEGSRNLDILGKVKCYEQRVWPEHMGIGQDEFLPSWVPDWGVSTPMVRAFHRAMNNSFDACKGYEYRPQASDSDILIVRGKIVSKMLYAVDYAFDRKYFMDPDRSWLNLDWYLEQLLKIPESHGRGLPTRDRVLKTLLADNADGGSNTPYANPLSPERIQALLHAYDIWPRLAARDEEIADRKRWEADLKFLQNSSLILQGKRLAVCEGGYLALVPRMAGCACATIYEEIGVRFEIAVLHGSKVPVMLANCQVDDPNEPWYRNAYRVWGQCYLEDHMYGEAVTWEDNEGDVMVLL